jgi:hypothetical protein
MLRSALLTPGAKRVMRTSGAFHIAFATRMSRIARIMCTPSAWDVRGMLLRQHVTHECHTRGMRTSDVACVSSIRIADCVGIVRGTISYFWSVL